MMLPSHGPEPCASANSATPAFLMFQSLSRDCLIIIQHILLNVNTNFQKNLKNFEFILLVHFGLFKVSDETAIYNKKDGHIQTARSILLHQRNEI